MIETLKSQFLFSSCNILRLFFLHDVINLTGTNKIELELELLAALEQMKTSIELTDHYDVAEITGKLTAADHQ